MAFRISSSGQVKNCVVALTASKSISNRALIIQTLCENPVIIKNLSTSTDTQGLLKALKVAGGKVDVADAGTSFRFLASLLSIQKGEFLLTGNERMKQRPIGPLVDTLRSLGASIEYVGIEGFPPLKITGRKLSGGEVSIDRSLSSQFVSSLLLIAPIFEKGLTLHLEGKSSSDSYLEMTLRMLENFNIKPERNGDTITIFSGKYSATQFVVENDWSAASYWYSLCAMNPGSEFRLIGLNENSLQGDRVVADIMQTFGVHTKFEVGSVVISSEAEPQKNNLSEFKYDFSSHPDLVMTIAVLCMAKNIKGEFTGVSSLRIKESDRLSALKSELQKCGAEVIVKDDNLIVVPGSMLRQPDIIQTYNDHRIAMAFAPLASLLGSISFDSIDVVSKSYPEFWEQLALAGIEMK